MKKKILLLIDLVFLTRPIIIVPVWGFCAFGVSSFMKLSFAYAVSTDTVNRIIPHYFFIGLEPKQYLLILLYSLSAASVYVINQIADYDVDKSNGGFPLLVCGNISKKSALLCAVVCALLSVVGPIIMGNIVVAVLSAVAVAVGIIYSCKPFSLSGRPFFDFLTNAFEAALAFGAGWCIAGGQIGAPLCTRVIPYFLLMCAGSISSTIPDTAGDGAHGKITTAVRFGYAYAHRIALSCLAASVLASLVTADYIALVCAALVMPLYLFYFIRPNSLNMELTYKVGGAMIMAVSTVTLPLLLPAGIVIYIITRYYFRKRHNIAYPSLTLGAIK